MTGRPDLGPSAATSDERLRGLIEANLAIVGDLDLHSVLRRIVAFARDLVGARYAALGVVRPDGTGLEDFVSVGMSQSEVLAIGRLPEGRGLLGALIDEPRVIRLDHLDQDPRSVGFPDGHPAMDSFLGVPIHLRHEVLGNLYLTEASSGKFDVEDETMAGSLAAVAAVAIKNARLFAESKHRQDWLDASTQLTQRLLTATVDETLPSVVDIVLRLADADLVALVELLEKDPVVTVTAAAGLASDRLMHARVPVRGTATETVLSTSAPVMLDGTEAGAVPGPSLPRLLDLGPSMVLPLGGHRGVRGALVVSRNQGRAPFTEADLEMATTFASHASLGIELAEARRGQQQMVLLEDRARIARDLHDHVIQLLFAAGLTVQGVSATLTGDARIAMLDSVVDLLDDAVKQIRTSIFHLQSREDAATGLRSRILQAARELRPALGFEARIGFEGPVDAVADSALADDVVAVVREALANVGKHAAAQHASVLVRASHSALVVVVEDDGVGMGPVTRRSGLENLRQRADGRGGHLVLGTGSNGGGTRVSVSLPLDGNAQDPRSGKEHTGQNRSVPPPRG